MLLPSLMFHCRVQICMLGAFLALLLVANEAWATSRHALLVGCSTYPDSSISSLPGAENDVVGFEAILSRQLGFDDVTSLVGWPEDPQTRPTYENIVREFERLIRETDVDSQVVIVMAGHGSQLPVSKDQANLLDPKNPEPDGFDETFIPADYGTNGKMLLDNQIGIWLAQLKKKGCHVWIVFDSCHSGTLTRGVQTEQGRNVDPTELGVDADEIAEAVQRANVLAGQGDSTARYDSDIPSQDERIGSVVAFYAAQAFETAPEVTRPMGADPKDKKNKHGLLSFHLSEVLRDLGKNATYRDLGEAIILRYRADGRRRPTPSWEGDLDREVLGFSVWPKPPAIVVESADESELRLSGGSLAGLQTSTVLAVFMPQDKERKSPVGYLQVVTTTPISATARPCAFNGVAARPRSEFTTYSRCKIVEKSIDADVVILGLKAWSGVQPIAFPEAVAKVIEQQSKNSNSYVQLTDQVEEADWILAAVVGDRIEYTLLPADELDLFRQGSPDVKKDYLHVRYANDSVSEPEKLATMVANDLHKVVVWNNLWKVTQAYQAPSPFAENADVILRANIVGNDNRDETNSRLKVGTRVELKLVNTSYQSYWYTAFYLDPDYGIKMLVESSIDGRDPQALGTQFVEQGLGTISAQPAAVGSNGIVVISTLQRDVTEQPKFEFLGQAPIGKSSRSAVGFGQASTPFQNLMKNIVTYERPLTRSSTSEEEPQISAWSWVTPPE